MNILLIAPLKYLSLTQDQTFNVSKFLLTNELKYKNRFLGNPATFPSFGNRTIHKILGSPILYFEGSIYDAFPQLKGITDLRKIGGFFSDVIHEILIELWYIKDHSINASELFIICNSEPASFNAHTVTTNSQGKYHTTNIIREDIEKFESLDNELFEYFKVQQDLIPLERDEDARITRSFNFLKSYIWNTNPVMKLAFNVMILECLFTTNATEITHQVSERTALYIGTDIENRKYVYEVVKEAYKIRSKYVHGGKITKSEDEIIDLCLEMDSITRFLLTKIISDRSTDVFLLPESEANKKKFDLYFRDLIFEIK